MDNMIRTNVYLPTYQKEQIEELAKDENTSASEMIRRAIDAYLLWRASLPKQNDSHSSPL
jgi:Arc/MetJ-type ribon-helix-helix transcriptional regulator